MINSNLQTDLQGLTAFNISMLDVHIRGQSAKIDPGREPCYSLYIFSQ